MSKTALVTGASEGIGAEFAKILANLGYDLILVARGEDKLNQLADRIRNEFEVNSSVIVADLSKENAAQDLFQTVEANGSQVDFLVNNAGLLQNGFFTKLSLEKQEAITSVNIMALTSLTHLFANQMALQGSGHILNLSLIHI